MAAEHGSGFQPPRAAAEGVGALLSNPSLSDDGRVFRVDIATTQGVVPLQAPVGQIGELVHLLGRVSLASARIQGLPGHFPREGSMSLRPVPAQALGVSRGAPGQALVLLLVGATPLAFSLEAHLLKDFARELQVVADALGSTP